MRQELPVLEGIPDAWGVRTTAAPAVRDGQCVSDTVFGRTGRSGVGAPSGRPVRGSMAIRWPEATFVLAA